MKAITVWQPWAQLLAEGKKHNETRSWWTYYRGEILIHAAKKDPLQGISRMPDEGWKKALLSFGLHEEFNRFERFPTGAIIGAAVLTDCKLIDQEYHDFIKELCPEEFLYGDFTVGRYTWKLERPQLFKKPIPVSGKQGLWNFGQNVQFRNGELYIREAEQLNEKDIIDGANNLALQYFTAYNRMLQLTGNPEEANQLTSSLFEAMFAGNRPRPEPGAGGFTLYWDRR